TRKTVLGAEHPDTLTSMANLAYTCKSQGKVQDAFVLMENCSQLRNKVLGPNHPDTRQSSHDLSDWQDKHDSTLGDKPPHLPSQIKQSEHLQEVIARQTTAMVMAQPPHIQRQSAAGLFLGGHPLILASRSSSPAPGGHDLQEV
ncbi:hypothetical protein BJX76DRAFT_319638, partial [Aspergillus varians]